MSGNGLHDLFRGDLFLPGLARSSHRLQHSLCPNEAVRLGNGFFRCQSPVLPVSGADTHNGHLLFGGQPQFLAQEGCRLLKRQPRHMVRPANHQQLGPGRSCRLHLLPEAPLGSGLFGHQDPGSRGVEDGLVQLLCKGPLHGDHVGRRHSGLFA